MDADSKIEAKYPVFRNKVHVGNKIRRVGKEFHYEGEAKDLDLFGQQAFEPGSSKYITVVEGQDDAAAAYELTGSQFPCVSVHGASSAVADCKRAYEYLDSFEHIVVCFDRDDPGQNAAVKVAGIFKPGKVQILTLREFKDANDYLKAGRAKQFVKEWWQAPVYKPDGIKFGTQMWDEIINRPNHFAVPYPFDGLNKFNLRRSPFGTRNRHGRDRSR